MAGPPPLPGDFDSDATQSRDSTQPLTRRHTERTKKGASDRVCADRSNTNRRNGVGRTTQIVIQS
jgi:hypothetical protein